MKNLRVCSINCSSRIRSHKVNLRLKTSLQILLPENIVCDKNLTRLDGYDDPTLERVVEQSNKMKDMIEFKNMYSIKTNPRRKSHTRFEFTKIVNVSLICQKRSVLDCHLDSISHILLVTPRY